MIFKIGKIIEKYFHRIPPEDRPEFDRLRFEQNNFRAFILSVILVFEQSVFCFLLSSPGTVLRDQYLVIICFLFFYICFACIFTIRKPQKLRFYHKLHEFMLMMGAPLIGLFRLFVLYDTPHPLPTIYIAMLYGSAVLFEINVYEGFICYGTVSILAGFVIPAMNNLDKSFIYTADVVSNGIIAWVVVSIKHLNYIRYYNSKKEVELKNLELNAKSMEIEKINSDLLELSIKDVLTGLYNRRKLDEICRMEYLKNERYGIEFSIILMDIDFFKNVNDTFGHDTGDIVLKVIAEIVMQNIREVDDCGRWGGEEFLVVCNETSLHDAYQLAERLRVKIAEQEFSGDLKITASFGVASISECSGFNELFKLADIRLYEAKNSGRNIVVAHLSE